MTVAACPHCNTVLWWPHEVENEACDYCYEPEPQQGGDVGNRLYWPTGLQELRPLDRALALERGWWHDGHFLILRDGIIREAA